jgi:Flp pilus assembly protein CpaB
LAADVKPKNNRLLMVLGIVIAIVAFVLVILLGGGKSDSGAGARSQDVVVSAVDVPAGQQISEALVKIVKFAPDQVPVGAEATVKASVGKYAAVALPKNTILTTGNLVATVASLPAQKKPYLDIPPGQVAIAIPAGGELQNVAGFIQQDDRVDIIFNGSSGSKPSFKTTYQNLKVSRLGGPAAAAANGQAAPVSSSMIVYVSLDDAENLSFLFANGNFKLALRSQQDATKNDTTNTAGVTSDTFSAKFNLPK